MPQRTRDKADSNPEFEPEIEAAPTPRCSNKLKNGKNIVISDSDSDSSVGAIEEDNDPFEISEAYNVTFYSAASEQL